MYLISLGAEATEKTFQKMYHDGYNIENDIDADDTNGFGIADGEQMMHVDD